MTEGQHPARSLGLSTDRQKEPKTPPGRARFEDSASEEGTTGRTRARTSCPVQEPTGVSLDSGYSTDLSVPASAEEQKNNRPGLQHHQRSARLYVEYTRPRNRSRAPQGGASVGGTDRRSARTSRPGNPREPGFDWRSLETPGQVKASHIVLLSDF